MSNYAIIISVRYKTNNNVVFSCKYHVVWCPKYRRKVLVGEISERLKELIVQRCIEIQVDIIEMEIMPDHVHLLLEVDPQFGISKAVKSIKGFSSLILRKEFPSLKARLPTLWTNSYFVSTVGGAPLEVIKQYIENQEHMDGRVQPRGKGI
jgi:putative transposase